MEPTESFMKQAKGLARNPLGIIALFISLIYGSVCVILGVSLDNLNGPGERLPLIYFIIGFPILTLVAFTYLVIKHHGKLYSPGDFRNDDGFLDTLDPSQIRIRRRDEVKHLENADLADPVIPSTQDNPVVAAEVVPPKPSPGTVSFPVDRHSTLSVGERYANAERWVVRDLGYRLNVPFQPDQKLITTGGQFLFDAVARTASEFITLEVKYWETRKSSKHLKIQLQEILRAYQRLINTYTGTKRIRFFIALVFDELNGVDQGDYVEFVRAIVPAVTVEVFQYSALQAEYDGL